MFGFLGPNGSGKTTTIRMLLGLASATAGTISLLGHPIPSEQELALPKVGALVEGPAFYPYLSGRKNLLRMDAADRFSDAITRAMRVQSALTRVGLTNAAEKKAGNYSLGMKQRLGLANALLKPRELLILDEPTNGLDPLERRAMLGRLVALARDHGKTILVSTHVLRDVQSICDSLVLLVRGRVRLAGSVAALTGGAAHEFLLRGEGPLAEAAAALCRRGIPARLAADGRGLDVDMVDPTRTADLWETVHETGVRAWSLEPRQTPLEDVFLGALAEADAADRPGSQHAPA